MSTAMRRSRPISQAELSEMLHAAVAAGNTICEPTFDELATVMAPESLLAIIWKRQHRVRLTLDRQRVDFADDVPAWLADAIKIYETHLVELMRDEFLGSWEVGPPAYHAMWARPRQPAGSPLR
jgi:hypothetical protein